LFSPRCCRTRGLKQLKEVERYTAPADQARLGQLAVAELPDEENKP
jgi:hypothetical protein